MVIIICGVVMLGSVIAVIVDALIQKKNDRLKDDETRKMLGKDYYEKLYGKGSWDKKK